MMAWLNGNLYEDVEYEKDMLICLLARISGYHKCVRDMLLTSEIVVAIYVSGRCDD